MPRSAPGDAPGRTQADKAVNRDLTLLRAPCINIPAGLGPNRLPIGLSLTGPHYSDRRLPAVAAAVAPVLDLAIRLVGVRNDHKINPAAKS